MRLQGHESLSENCGPSSRFAACISVTRSHRSAAETFVCKSGSMNERVLLPLAAAGVMGKKVIPLNAATAAAHSANVAAAAALEKLFSMGLFRREWLWAHQVAAYVVRENVAKNSSTRRTRGNKESVSRESAGELLDETFTPCHSFHLPSLYANNAPRHGPRPKFAFSSRNLHDDVMFRVCESSESRLRCRQKQDAGAGERLRT